MIAARYAVMRRFRCALLPLYAAFDDIMIAFFALIFATLFFFYCLFRGSLSTIRHVYARCLRCYAIAYLLNSHDFHALLSACAAPRRRHLMLRFRRLLCRVRASCHDLPSRLFDLLKASMLMVSDILFTHLCSPARLFALRLRAADAAAAAAAAALLMLARVLDLLL